MWEKLLVWILPTLARWILAFVANLAKNRMDNPDFVRIVSEIVRGVAYDHPEWTGEQKRSFAFGAIKHWGTELGRDVRDSIINTAIELEVQTMKEGQP